MSNQLIYKMHGYLSSRQFAELVGVKVARLQRWDKSGKLVPVERTPCGKRYYIKEQAGDALLILRKEEAEKLKRESKKSSNEQ